MRNIVFLDTNVWTDYFIVDRANHSKTMELLSLCKNGDCLIATASTSVNDLHYLLQLCEKRAIRGRGIEVTEKMALVAKEQATACVELITEMATVIPVGYNEIRVARSLSKDHPDFEDNVIVACALKANPLLFVTNDKSLIKHAPLPAVNVVDAVAHLKALKEL